MKAKKIIYSLTLLISLLFIACSTDNEPVELDTPSIETVNDDALLFQFGQRTFTDSTNLDLTIPGYVGDMETWEPRITLIFYSPAEADATTWFSIPNVNPEKDYKIYYTYLLNSSESEDIIVKLLTEKTGSSELLGTPLSFRDIHLVAIKLSVFQELTLEDLDLRDYNEVIEYFNLAQD